jgi:hypothetical protein
MTPFAQRHLSEPQKAAVSFFEAINGVEVLLLAEERPRPLPPQFHRSNIVRLVVKGSACGPNVWEDLARRMSAVAPDGWEIETFEVSQGFSLAAPQIKDAAYQPPPIIPCEWEAHLRSA